MTDPDVEIPVDGFEAVFTRELSYVRARRQASSMSEPSQWADDLYGLAMSGGGIRSAIFNLGGVAGPAPFWCLSRVDYMSSAFGRRLHRDLLERPHASCGGDISVYSEFEGHAVLHERSQYLAPRGLWLRGGSVLLMGTLVNFLTLSPVILFAAVVIAIYGGFRLTDLLGFAPQAIDPRIFVGALLIGVSLRSVVENLLRTTLWPIMMQMEWSDRGSAPWSLRAFGVVAFVSGLRRCSPVLRVFGRGSTGRQRT